MAQRHRECGLGRQGKRPRAVITFRDGACYDVIVKPDPLYPLNSIMHHGMVLGTKF